MLIAADPGGLKEQPATFSMRREKFKKAPYIIVIR